MLPEGDVLRYAIVSDIHANLQAWNSVLTDIRSVGADTILCLGDIVGYGPRPADVLEQVYAHVHHFVLGNHDAVIAGTLDPACFNQDARTIIDWTRDRLDTKAADFFREVPYVLEGDDFRCAHADPAAPTRYGYLLEPDDARTAWEQCTEQLIFVGHSHVPGIFVVGASGTPHWLPSRDFGVEEGKRYIVNVGSVGQPRDGDVRACYCVYEPGRGAVVFRRVPFDLDAYRCQLEQACLPSRPSYFLSVAQARAPTPLREILDFHPPKASVAVAEDYSVERLVGAVKAARRWRLGASLLLLLLVGCIAAGICIWEFGGARAPAVYAATDVPGSAVGSAGLPQVGRECLTPPEPVGAVGAENRLPKWTVVLASPKLQSVRAATWADPAKPADKARRVFAVRSEEPLDFALLSAPIPADSGMRFTISASLRPLEFASGHVALCMVQQLADGTEKTIIHHPIDSLEPASRWRRSSATMPRKRGGLHADGPVRLALRGQFAGEILIRACSLKLKEIHGPEREAPQ